MIPSPFGVLGSCQRQQYVKTLILQLRFEPKTEKNLFYILEIRLFHSRQAYVLNPSKVLFPFFPSLTWLYQTLD